MGEAKQKYERMRASFLAEVDVWIRPPTDEELRLVSEIERLEFQTIKRIEPELLEYMRMQPQQCHENAAAYEKMDPDNTSRSITGWWRIGDAYVAHSVIQKPEGMACITPHPILTDAIDFAPDPRIVWHLEGDRWRVHFADGGPVPALLRSNPGRVIDHQLKVRERLLSGMNPFHAVQLPYDIE